MRSFHYRRVTCKFIPFLTFPTSRLGSLLQALRSILSGVDHLTWLQFGFFSTTFKTAVSSMNWTTLTYLSLDPLPLLARKCTSTFANHPTGTLASFPLRLQHLTFQFSSVEKNLWKISVDYIFAQPVLLNDHFFLFQIMIFQCRNIMSTYPFMHLPQTSALFLRLQSNHMSLFCAFIISAHLKLNIQSMPRKYFHYCSYRLIMPRSPSYSSLTTYPT